MKIASYGIQKAVVEAYLSGRWVREYKKSGSLSHKSMGICPEFSLEDCERPSVMVKAKLGSALQEIREAFSKNYSLTAVHSERKRLDFRYEKRRSPRGKDAKTRPGAEKSGQGFRKPLRRNNWFFLTDIVQKPLQADEIIPTSYATRAENFDNAFIHPTWWDDRVHYCG